MRLADPMIINMQNYYHGAITNKLGDVSRSNLGSSLPLDIDQ